MNDGTPSILAQNLTKQYDKLKAVSNMSFDLSPGEIVGFFGPNSASKTPTMRILFGLSQSASGRAHAYGVFVAKNPLKTKTLLGYMCMPENNPLPEEVHTKEYLRAHALLKRVPPKEQQTRIKKGMASCGLIRTANHKISGKLNSQKASANVLVSQTHYLATPKQSSWMNRLSG